MHALNPLQRGLYALRYGRASPFGERSKLARTTAQAQCFAQVLIQGVQLLLQQLYAASVVVLLGLGQRLGQSGETLLVSRPRLTINAVTLGERYYPAHQLRAV